jgi:2-phospho-L-lactate guanylyltransferase
MIVAVLPVKPFSRAKSRLAPALAPAARAALARGLYRHTLEVLRNTPSIDHLVVVGQPSASPSVVAIADPGRGLNAAVAAGLAAAGDADAALVLPTDLPLLSEDAIDRLLAQLTPGRPQIVIAPDRWHDGTNALLLTPPTVIAPTFGSASFARHRQTGLAAGIVVTVHHDPALALDLDHPDDLATVPAPVVEALLALGASDEAPIPLVARR